MPMYVSRDDLIGLIYETGCKIDKILDQRKKDQQIIADLNSENINLTSKNLIMVNQLKNYIQELEKIRTHYVNSNNNDRR